MANQETNRKFLDIMKFVWNNKHSDFYRKKFSSAGINPMNDIKGIEDITKLPFLTKDELKKTEPYRLLHVPESDIQHMRFSSGTSGGDMTVKFATEEESSFVEESKDEIKKYRELRVLMLLHPAISVNVYLRCIFYGIKIVAPCDIHNLPAAARLASRLSLNYIFTTPTIAMVFSRYLKKHYPLEKVKRVGLLGELVSPLKLKLLREAFPNARIVNYYAMAETSTLGISCRHTEDIDMNMVHPLSKMYFFEIIDPETMKPVESGKEGEIVITNLQKSAMPMIRYRTGDLARFQEKKCSCGEPGPLLRILGRAGFDSLKIGGGELHADNIERAIGLLQSYVKEDFQLHAYEDLVGGIIRPRLSIDVVPRDFLKDREGVKAMLSSRLSGSIKLSPRLTLKEAIERNLFQPFNVNFIGEPKTSLKSKRIIDHRSQPD